MRDVLRSCASEIQDIDIVVDGSDCLDKSVAGLNPTRTKFGGWRFSVERWEFDVWRVEDTWAFQSHIPFEGIESILEIPFFNWDAVLFDVQEKALIHTPGYLESLDRGYLDVNFGVNPNPLRMAAKTIRFLKGGASLSRSLENILRGWVRTYGKYRIIEESVERYSIPPSFAKKALDAY